jgi:hypothetical protein
VICVKIRTVLEGIVASSCGWVALVDCVVRCVG